MFQRIMPNPIQPHYRYVAVGAQTLRKCGSRRCHRVMIGVVTALSLMTMLYIFIDRKESRRLVTDEVCGKSSNHRFVGFWHIGGSNAQSATLSRDEFVQKQVREIRSTHLFSDCNDYDVSLNYVTRLELSDETKEILSEDDRIYELPPNIIGEMEDDEEYFEFTTLMELHWFCKTLPDDEDAVVFYLHSKTSDSWRRYMENYILGPECVECLEDSEKMACGPSLVTDDWIWQHFSGNFWMTRCQHVRTLNPPYTPKIMDDIHTILFRSHETASGFPHAFPPYGRYSAEYWLMNDAGEIPEHLHDTNLWPNLKNEHEEHHESLINRENICTKHVPSKIINMPQDEDIVHDEDIQ